MPTKIRLQRHGKRGSSFYHIVIADNRAPRDGKFIEKIGTYNPNTNPASIDLKFDKALNWLSTGAEPTDTVRAILSYEGVLYRNHLNKGVTKGAFSADEAEVRFKAWKDEKVGKIQKKIEGLDKSEKDKYKAMLDAEAEVNKKREKEILAKTSAMAEEAHRAAEAAKTSAAAPVAEAVVEEVAVDSEVKIEVESPAAAEVVAENTAAESPAEEKGSEKEEENSGEKAV